MNGGVHDFYKILKIQRNATNKEIKEAYRKMAMALHPDRHDGCEVKGDAFKRATEAYQVLSDNSQRRAHDRILNGHSKNKPNFYGNGPMPNYRKVYAPRPPPGFKTFDPKKHYDMHYGEGMMWEEIERARKRAERASGRKGGGYEYESPLGKGFDFQEGVGGNPFRSVRNNKKPNANRPRGETQSSEDIEYEEGNMDLGSGNYMGSKKSIRGREIVSERMKERKKNRKRNRGDPLNGRTEDSCTLM